MTPEEFQAHVKKYWGAGSVKTLGIAKEMGGMGKITIGRADAVHRFQRNVTNFKIKLAKSGKAIFQKSFDMQRFNSDGGKAWKPVSQHTLAKRRRRGNFSKTILVDSGTMRRSITYSVKGALQSKVDYGMWKFDLKQKRRLRQRLNAKKNINSSADGVIKIYTDPRAYNRKYSTGRNSRPVIREKDGKATIVDVKYCYAAIHNEGYEGGYYYGASGVPAIKRQFIGHSTVLDNEMATLGREIFLGFA